jgi:hypothetical protein
MEGIGRLPIGRSPICSLLSSAPKSCLAGLGKWRITSNESPSHTTSAAAVSLCSKFNARLHCRRCQLFIIMYTILCIALIEDEMAAVNRLDRLALPEGRFLVDHNAGLGI